MRKDGYYWIRLSEYENNINSKWVIAVWNGRFKCFEHESVAWYESELIEIDERRIERPD